MLQDYSMKMYIVGTICFSPYLLGGECRAQCKITLTYADINEITHAIFTVSLTAYPGVLLHCMEQFIVSTQPEVQHLRDTLTLLTALT